MQTEPVEAVPVNVESVPDVPENVSSGAPQSTSAMVVPIAILIYSICQTNQPKEVGLVYIILLILFVSIRTVLFKQFMKKDDFSLKLKKPGCLNNLPLLGTSPSVDIFVAVFSLTYAFIPMIQEGYNPLILVILGIYALFNIALKFNCYTIEMLIGDIIFAMLSGVASMYLLLSIFILLNAKPAYLFVSSVASNKEYCSMPSKQKMVCSVYKNGELVTKTKS